MRHLRLIVSDLVQRHTPLGFHPDYGLPDDYRLRVLDEAADFGVPVTAARHRLSQSAIYRWRKAAKANNAKE